jgi:hypothetical protein
LRFDLYIFNSVHSMHLIGKCQVRDIICIFSVLVFATLLTHRCLSTCVLLHCFVCSKMWDVKLIDSNEDAGYARIYSVFRCVCRRNYWLAFSWNIFIDLEYWTTHIHNPDTVSSIPLDNISTLLIYTLERISVSVWYIVRGCHRWIQEVDLAAGISFSSITMKVAKVRVKYLYPHTN